MCVFVNHSHVYNSHYPCPYTWIPHVFSITPRCAVLIKTTVVYLKLLLFGSVSVYHITVIVRTVYIIYNNKVMDLREFRRFLRGPQFVHGQAGVVIIAST